VKTLGKIVGTWGRWALKISFLKWAGGLGE